MVSEQGNGPGNLREVGDEVDELNEVGGPGVRTRPV